MGISTLIKVSEGETNVLGSLQFEGLAPACQIGGASFLTIITRAPT